MLEAWIIVKVFKLTLWSHKHLAVLRSICYEGAAKLGHMDTLQSQQVIVDPPSRDKALSHT